MKLDEITERMRVEGGEPGTDDHDTGTVVETDGASTEGHEVRVAWDSGVITWGPASLLQPLRE